MRKIGSLPDAVQADVLTKVLAAQGVGAEARPVDGAFDLWVHDDAHLDVGRRVLAEYVADPGAERFRAAAAEGKARQAAQAARDSRYRARAEQARRSLHGANGGSVVSTTLLAASLAVAVMTQAGQGGPVDPLLLTVYPPIDLLPEVRAGQVWRLFTPVILHWGVLHLLFNLSAWWSWARQIEARKGSPFFALFVAVSAAGSNLVQFAWNFVTNPLGLSLVAGLSGVLYALFGYAWIKGRIDPGDGLAVPDQVWWQLMGWLVLCFTGLLGPIANGAHLGGLGIGALWAVIDVWWFHWRKRRLTG